MRPMDDSYHSFRDQYDPQDESDPNQQSFMDIVFLVSIFCMASLCLTVPLDVFKVDLPSVKTTGKAAPEVTFLYLSEKGVSMEQGGEVITLGAESLKEKEVVVIVDKRVDFGVVANFEDVLKPLGVLRVSYLSE